jgi:hypothetical protein
MPDDPKELTELAAPLHYAVGKAMDTYSHIEAHLAAIVGNLLKIDYRKSHIIFFAISNMPSRLELIESLFSLHLKGDQLPAFKKYWASVERYLKKLATFRNALAHWHPHINVYVNRLGTQERPARYVAALAHPIPGTGTRPIEARHIQDFLDDCQFARDVLSAIKPASKRRPRSLPRIFRQPITRQPKADIQLPPTPKAQQPRRPPSVAKLTKFEKRAKAAKEARERAKNA